MTFETPEQYELRTMPQAFGGCAKGGGTFYVKRVVEKSPEFYEKLREHLIEEGRKSKIAAEIDRLMFMSRDNPQLREELMPKINQLDYELNDFKYLPKEIINQ